MSSKWGRYQTAMATIDTTSPTAQRTRSSFCVSRTAADGDERDREVRQRPAPDEACDEDGDEGGGSARPIGLQGRDDEDAHREEGEAVAARLTRDVEEQRRRRREEEEEDAGERADPHVEPGRDERDADEERDRRPEPQRDRRVADDRPAWPSRGG